MKKYVPINLERVNNKELRREYSRLKSIAKKRIKRLESSDYAKLSGYRTVMGYLLPLKDFRPGLDDAQLKHSYMAVEKFLNSSTSTIRGIRAEVREKVAQLNDSGYKFVNEKNFASFVEFMAWVRGYNTAMEYEYIPEDAMAVFEQGQKKNLSEEELQGLYESAMREEYV